MTIGMEQEIEFLRDQVYRLNSALAFYQSKAPTLRDDQDGLFPPDGQTPDWLTDKRLLSPLVSEYDAHIKNLKKQLAAHEEEEKHLGKQMQKLIDENQKLTRELKEQVQLQLDSLNEQTRNESEDGQTTGSLSGLKYQEIVDNLQEQLSICLREKDHVDNLLQDALGECDRLRAVSERGLQPLVDNLEQQCCRKIESYGRSIAALNTEVGRSKLQLNEKQHQLEMVEEENATLFKDLERLKSHLNRKTEELEINGTGNKDLESLTQAQEEVIQTLSEKQRQLTDECVNVTSEKDRLLHNCSALQEKISHLESHHASALEQLKSNVQLVENVLLEKDQAVIRVKQLEEESHMLKSSLADLVAEAGEKTKQTAEEIRSESAAKVKQLTDYSAELEDELRIKSNQVERLKRQLGQEGLRSAQGLTQDANEISGDPASPAELMQSLRDELHSMELKKDEMKGLLEEMEKEKTLQQSDHERLRNSWREKEKNLNLYIEDLILEADKARAEKVEIATEKESLQELVQRLRVDASAFETRLSMRDSSALESLAEKEASARSRLEAAAEAHRDAVQVLRTAISRKDKLVEDLRRELSTTIEDLESNRVALKSDRETFRQRIAQLSSDLREEKGQRAESEKLLSRTETRLSSYEDRYKLLEEEKTTTQKIILEKLDTEKALRSKMNCLEKEFQRLLLATGKEFDGVQKNRSHQREKSDQLPLSSETRSERIPGRVFELENRLRCESRSSVMSSDEMSVLKNEVNENLKKIFMVTEGTKKKKTV